MKRISLPNQILIGFLVGISIGLFFGERIAPVNIIGEVFMALLQMAVLPFVSFSLMSGLGQMTFHEAKILAKKGIFYLLILWAISFIILLFFPLAFPEWKAASYFSSSLLNPGQQFDFLTLFVPKNPFEAYANNIVPAVVVFSMAIGIALMGIEKKGGLIQGLKTINEALIRITNFVIRLAPLGVAAISAHAAGTLQIDEINKLEVYLLIYVVFALIVTFYLFPVLITVLTPVKYKAVLMRTRGLLITAFATGNLFVVISLLITRCAELLTENDIDKADAEQHVGVLIPTAINFPNAGKLLSLSFITFAGWFSGALLPSSAIPQYIVLGFFTFFGNTIAALEFLMDFFRIPIDTIQLFMLTDLFVSRFGTLVAAMFYITLSILVTFSIFQPIRIRWGKLGLYLAGAAILLSTGLFGLRIFFAHMYDDNYQGSESLMSMDGISTKVPSKVLKEANFIPDNPYFGSLESIQRRGYIRVGYFKDALPYAFFNNKNELVGYDIDLAYAMAYDINVSLEFLEVDRSDIQFVLDNNIVDLIMCGVMTTTNQNITYSATYSKGTMAFLVEDYWREDFNSQAKVLQKDSLKLGMIKIPYYMDKIKNLYPHASFVEMDSPKEFLEGKTDLDAFVVTAEAGSAWTLLYPNYSVAIPYPSLISAPISIAISKNNINFVSYLNTWLDLKQYDGTFTSLTDYWIYGKRDRSGSSRWCILDDVLRRHQKIPVTEIDSVRL